MEAYATKSITQKREKPEFQSAVASVFLGMEKVTENIFAHFFQADMLALMSFYLVDLWFVALSSLLILLIRNIAFGQPKWSKKNLWGIPSGIPASAGVFFFVLGSSAISPVIALPLDAAIALYTGVIQVFTRQVSWKRISLPIMLVITGAVAIGFTTGAIPTWPLTGMLAGILLIFLPADFFSAWGEIIEQKGSNATNDVVALNVIHVASTTVSGSLAVCVYVFSRYHIEGILKLWHVSLSMVENYSLGFVLLGLFVCGELIAKFAAKRALQATEVLIFVSPQLVIGAILTFAGNLMFHGIFGDIPTGWLALLATTVGTLFIGSSIFLLRRNPIAKALV